MITSNEAYTAYIESCKVPKSQAKVKNIVYWILVGIRKGYTTQQIADKLNAKAVLTIQGKKWTYHALQMQLLKMSRLDNASSLAWALGCMLDAGDATESDVTLLKERTRSVH